MPQCSEDKNGIEMPPSRLGSDYQYKAAVYSPKQQIPVVVVSVYYVGLMHVSK